MPKFVVTPYEGKLLLGLVDDENQKWIGSPMHVTGQKARQIVLKILEGLDLLEQQQNE